MPNPHRPLLIASALSGALGVVVGAFAAHGAGPQVKTLLATGAHYLLLHALLAAVCAVWNGSGLVRLAGWLALAGGLVFCAALYILARLQLSVFGAVAPIGGLLMILGWIALAVAAWRSPFVNASRSS